MMKSGNSLRSVLSAALLMSVLLFGVSCDRGDDEPSQQTVQAFDDLQRLVEQCEAARQDAAFFTADSYAAYAGALEAARHALDAGVRAGGRYADLLQALEDARRALVVPEWTPITDYLPQCAMLMILSEDALPQPVADADRLGAFSGDKCLGLARPEMQPNGKRYFFLQVLQDAADEYGTDIVVTLRYHSTASCFVYLSQDIPYADQSILGSYQESYRPVWR